MDNVFLEISVNNNESSIDITDFCVKYTNDTYSIVKFPDLIKVHAIFDTGIEELFSYFPIITSKTVKPDCISNGNNYPAYFCPKCKKPLNYTNFCSNCGVKIDWTDVNAI